MQALPCLGIGPQSVDHCTGALREEQSKGFHGNRLQPTL